jgi:hypothetical protein
MSPISTCKSTNIAESEGTETGNFSRFFVAYKHCKMYTIFTNYQILQVF